LANKNKDELVNLVEFGEIKWWSGNEPNEIESHPIQPLKDKEGNFYWLPVAESRGSETHIGVEWNEPRDVYNLEVIYKDAEFIPKSDSVKVQYWQCNWPTPAPERLKGAKRGWIGADDSYHGEWTRANTKVTASKNKHIYSFEHLDIVELPDEQKIEEAEDWNAFFRKTLKIRLVFKNNPGPAIADLKVYSKSLWKHIDLDIFFGCGENDKGRDWSGTIEAYNGRIKDIGPLDFDQDDAIAKNHAWKCRIEGSPKGIRTEVMYASRLESSDSAIITLRTRAKSFSFLVGDVIKRPIFIKDYGVFIKKSQEQVTPSPFPLPYGERIKVRGKRKFLYNQVDCKAYLNQLASSNKKSIYDLVISEPEQSYERAFKEIPPLQKARHEESALPPLQKSKDVVTPLPSLTEILQKYGRYLILGCEGNRQEFALRFNGHLFINKKFLKPYGRDIDKLLWPGMEIQYKFGTGDTPDFREREDGCVQSLKEGYLPVVTTSWIDREIEYKEEAFSSFLDDSISRSLVKRGDEDIVCLMQFRTRNTTKGKKKAKIWFTIQPSEELSFEDGFILAKGRVVLGETVKDKWKIQKYTEPLARAYINVNNEGTFSPKTYVDKLENTHGISNAIVYEVELDSYEEHTINLAIPFTSELTPSPSPLPYGEREKAHHAFSVRGKRKFLYYLIENKNLLSSLDYNEKLREVVSYWKNYIGQGMQVNVPDPIINDFYKAVPIHVAITVDKDPISGLYEVPPATYEYGPCGNEACWQIRQLDYRGYHKRAQDYLEAFIQLQGKMPFDGNFKSKEGSFQACGTYGDEIHRGVFAYNLDHGFILFQLAEHYLLTRDEEWLRRVLPNLLKGCEFIIRERASTMGRQANGSKCPEYGLLPAGHMEDNQEWRHWFAVNAYAYYGMKLTADILKEINHPEAERISQETRAYCKDIREAVEKAMIESPVVKLLDGTYVPHIPARAGLRGRELGWFREGGYGPLHLVGFDIIKLDEEITTWILKDLEDNIFISREFGWPIDLEKHWFSQGGVTCQPLLLNNGIVYLKRGQIEHAIRWLYNSLAVSLYPDVKVFAEWALEPGYGVGPFYKTSDECQFLNWLRMFLVYEEENKLFLAMGTPRNWLKNGKTITVKKAATYFGTISYELHSKVTSGEIEAILNPPKRSIPEKIVVCLRHPEKKRIQSVAVNGVKHQDYDADKEVIYLTKLSDEMKIVVKY